MFIQKVQMQLPVNADQIWKVVPANDELENNNVATGNSLCLVAENGTTKWQPVYAVANGEVAEIRVGYFYIKHAEEEFCCYMHCIRDSVRVKVGDHVFAGQQIAEISDETGIYPTTINPRLCIAVSNIIGLPPHEDNGASGKIFKTLPVEFKDYECFNTVSQTWETIALGMPHRDQLIRRKIMPGNNEYISEALHQNNLEKILSNSERKPFQTEWKNWD